MNPNRGRNTNPNRRPGGRRIHSQHYSSNVSSQEAPATSDSDTSVFVSGRISRRGDFRSSNPVFHPYDENEEAEMQRNSRAGVTNDDPDRQLNLAELRNEVNTVSRRQLQVQGLHQYPPRDWNPVIEPAVQMERSQSIRQSLRGWLPRFPPSNTQLQEGQFMQRRLRPAGNHLSWRSSLNFNRMSVFLQKHMMTDSTALERAAYNELQGRRGHEQEPGQGVQHQSLNVRERFVSDSGVPFSKEHIEEYEKYLKIEEDTIEKDPADRNIVGKSNRRLASVMMKLAWTGMLNQSKIVRFKYNRTAYMMLFLITALMTLVMAQLLNPAFNEAFSLQGSLACPIESQAQDIDAKLEWIQTQTRVITRMDEVKELEAVSTLRVQQAESLLFFAKLEAGGDEIYPDFPDGCDEAADILAASVVSGALRRCVEENCEMIVPGNVGELTVSDTTILEVGSCKTVEVACELLPGLEFMDLPGDVIAEFDNIREMLTLDNVKFNVELNGMVEDVQTIFAVGIVSSASTKAFARFEHLQLRGLQLSLVYSSYMLLILLLAPPLILSKPGRINRFVLGYLVPSRILVYGVALIGFIVSELAREEQFMQWLKRAMADSCQVNPEFTAMKAEKIVDVCNELFTVRETIRANRFFLKDLHASAEAYRSCYADDWQDTSFGTAQDREMAQPYPFANPVDLDYSGIQFDISRDVDFAESIGLNISLVVDDEVSLPSDFWKGFSFESATAEFDTIELDVNLFNTLETVCNVPTLIEKTYISKNVSVEAIQLVVLFIAKALIAPCLLKLIWLLFAEFSPLAHSRGKAEFFIGTRDDAQLKDFLTIDQYFVLKGTARKLDRISNRKWLALYSLLLPTCIILVKTLEVTPASAEEYGREYGFLEDI